MRVLVRNEANHGEERLQHPWQQDRNSSNSEFLSNHPPVFLGARDLLDVDYWLCTTESKFRLLHCTEYQKTLYAAQQLRRSIGAWWASYLAALQGNCSVYDYTKEFNNLAQYRGHQVDSDAKKAGLYHKGLNIQLQGHLVQNLNLYYNDLASTAIDQEGTMRACEMFEEKKRKRTTPRPAGGSSSGAPPKYRMVYTPPAGQPRRPP
jgi:hypothetical protein